MAKFKAYLELELAGNLPIDPMIVTAKNEKEAVKKAKKMADEEWDWENIEEMLEPMFTVNVTKMEKLKGVI
jgi:ribosomal protein S1